MRFILRLLQRSPKPGHREEKQPGPETVQWHYYSRGATSPEKPGYYRVGVMNGNIGYAQTMKWNGVEWENKSPEPHRVEIIAWRELIEKERQRLYSSN